MAESSKEQARQKKEANAKSRQMFDKEITHIRMGDWRSTQGTSISLVGRTDQLHGWVCTDCPSSPQYQPKESA